MFYAARWRSLFSNRNARFAAEPITWPFEFRVFLTKFLDLQDLILADVGEILARIGRGPPDLQIQDAGIFAKADMLLKRRSAKRASATHRATNEPLPSAFILDG